jgi:pimeloyl-ACP methyl ester carboxylesterase
MTEPKLRLETREIQLPTTQTLIRFSEGNPLGTNILIFCHANPGDRRDYDCVTRALSPNYHWFALDWPGYGESPIDDGSRCSAEFFSQVLVEFVKVLELTNIVIVGHSVGGRACVHLALEDPARIRGMVLVASGGFTSVGFISKMFCSMMSSFLSIPPPRFGWLYTKHRSAENVKPIFHRYSHECASGKPLAVNRAVWKSFNSEFNDIREIVKKVNVKTVAFFGAHDPVISSADVQTAKKVLPSATTKIIVMDTGHLIFAEKTDEFNQHFHEFLKEICG